MCELNGAYAVDALDASEAKAVERHLLGCPRCRREVAELQEVAALLAYAGGPAPTRVWDGIAGHLGGFPEPAPPRTTGRKHRDVSVRIFTAVVAMAAVIIATLGLQVAQRNAPRPSAQIAWGSAVARADARQLTLRSADGSASAQAVVLADGTTYLGPNNLPALSSERSYQVWGQVGSDMVSLAVLHTPMSYQQFSTPAQTVALTVTDEPASGAVSTTHPAIVSTRVPVVARP
jgi:hypothetical protein